MKKAGPPKGQVARRKFDAKPREMKLLRGLYQIEKACDDFMDSRGMERGRMNPYAWFKLDLEKKRKLRARNHEDRIERMVADMGQVNSEI